MIRLANADDAAAICAIYNRYVLNTTISFEDTTVRAPAMAERISAVFAAGLPWYVCEEDGVILGYAYASPWRTRHAYRFSVEISAYVSPERKLSGIGSQLYAHLIDDLQQRGMHSVIAGISLPNPASVALHEKFGMTKVAHFKEVGFKFGRWIDVGYWEKQL
ncbi:N-acetyltransferase [Undibacterium sp. FT147W]|uniref:N-acetyltransferase n=1 Tax=Undibacterium rivi TaxID=2828729 RepID=A0ABS5GYB1_9BURK|nr:arsinothricin resistance N-acetyltransferase ArsN1 family B [Undibacterium rivi]MBR7791149.1 N-acetyltransferase [Undibacterium rivi]